MAQPKPRKAQSAYASRDSELSRAIHQSTELAEIAAGKNDFLHGIPPLNPFTSSPISSALIGTILSNILAVVISYFPGWIRVQVWVTTCAICMLILFITAIIDYRLKQDFGEFERSRERWEVDNFPEGEIQEMVQIYTAYGISDDDAQSVAKTLSKYPDFWIDHMLLHEIGIIPHYLRGGSDGKVSDMVVAASAFCLSLVFPTLALVFGHGELVICSVSTVEFLVCLYSKMNSCQWIPWSTVLGLTFGLCVLVPACAVFTSMFMYSTVTMSSSYNLLYQDRRQFVFEEAKETHTTAIFTLIAGFIAGSLLGVYFASLDATTAGSILLAIGTYITILTSTFSIRTNPLSVFIIFLTSFGAVILLIYVARVVLGYFSDSPFKLVLVFAALFAFVSELVYLWSRITWVEDTRMHQFIEIASGDGPISNRRRYKDVSLISFFRWITEIISFGILRVYFTVTGRKERAKRYPIILFESLSQWSEADKAKKIIITNQTLKRVKVCFYHRADYCCWVPVGGLIGGMYELDRGEELEFSPHWPSSAFRVKIFAHGVIDFELTNHPCVIRGHKYAFIDVGKPITVLSKASPPPSTRKSDSLAFSDSSDEENQDHMYFHLESIPRQPSIGSRPSGMKRVPSSRANLSAAGSHPSSPMAQTLLTPTTSVRKLFRHFLSSTDLSRCICILNESTAEIRVFFFSTEDLTFVRSLDSFTIKHMSHNSDGQSSTIGRGEWRSFEYDDLKQGDRQKFCIRVRTTLGQASMELSYCTALLGEAFVVRDPIVSGS